MKRGGEEDGGRVFISASIFGAELKNGNGLCVNYFKRRDLCEKRVF